MKTNCLKQLVISLFALFSLSACNVFESSDYPVVDSGLIVFDRSVLLGGDKSNFHWLGNDRMLVYAIDEPTFTTFKKEGKHLGDGIELYLWDVKNNHLSPFKLEQYGIKDAGIECVGEGYILLSAYQGGAWYKLPFQNVGDQIQFGKAQELLGNGYDNGTVTWPVNFSTCLWMGNIELPDWAKQVPKYDITPLKPEHGFLFLDKENFMAVPKGLYLYPPNSTSREGAKDLFKEMHITPVPDDTYGYSVNKDNVIYYAFKNAYKVDLRGSDITWWLYPDGHIENGGDWGDLMPRRNGDNKVIDQKYRYLSWYTPTAVYPVAANYYDHDTIDDFGLYAYMGDRNNPKRLVKGRVADTLQISPDGCKVAFLNDDRPYVKDGEHYKLQVIDLCKGDKQ